MGVCLDEVVDLDVWTGVFLNSADSSNGMSWTFVFRYVGICVSDLGIVGWANVFVDVVEDRTDVEKPFTPSGKDSFSRLVEICFFKLIRWPFFF